MAGWLGRGVGQGEKGEAGAAPPRRVPQVSTAEGYGSGGPSSAHTWEGGEQCQCQCQRKHHVCEGAGSPPSPEGCARDEARSLQSRGEGALVSQHGSGHGEGSQRLPLVLRWGRGREPLPVADAAVVGASWLGGNAFPADGDAGEIVLGLCTGQKRFVHPSPAPIPLLPMLLASPVTPMSPPLPALPSLAAPIWRRPPAMTPPGWFPVPSWERLRCQSVPHLWWVPR